MDPFLSELERLPCGRLLPVRQISDFGGTRRATPRAIVATTSAAEARNAIRIARAHEVCVHFRGSGHSIDGQSIGPGLLLVHRTAIPQVRFLEGERIAVSGSTQWQDLERILNAAGRTSPVLTDYLGLTVGGTLSVGGYGVRSVTRGGQFERVESVRFIDRDGNRHCMSRGDIGFARVLANLGRHGLIVEAVFETFPLAAREHVLEIRHRGLDELIDTVLRLDGAEITGFSAWMDRHNCVSELLGEHAGSLEAVFGSVGARRSMTSTARYAWLLHHRRIAWLGAFPDRCRVWADFKLPLATFGAFARRIDRLASSREFEDLAVRYVLACNAGAPIGTLAPTDAAAGRYAGMGLYFMPPPTAARVRACRRAVRRALEACLDLGGRPYLYGYAPLRQDEWRALYREAAVADTGWIEA